MICQQASATCVNVAKLHSSLASSSCERASIQECGAGNELPFRLALVRAKDFLGLLQCVPVQPHDTGLRAERRRQNRPGVPLALYLQNQPRFVLSIRASPVRMRQEMGARLERSERQVRYSSTLPRGCIQNVYSSSSLLSLRNPPVKESFVIAQSIFYTVFKY
jgi:hypothetical protein